jgi:hypothetical protein
MEPNFCELCHNCKVIGFGQFWCAVKQKEVEPAAFCCGKFVLDPDYIQKEEDE